MRICLAHSRYNLGGADFFVGRLAKGLAQRGHQVLCVATHKQALRDHVQAFKQMFDGAGIEWRENPEERVKSVATLRRSLAFLRNVLLEFQPDILHSHGEGTDFLVALVSRQFPRLTPIRTVHHERYGIHWLRGAPRLCERLVEMMIHRIGGFGRVIAVSERIQKQSAFGIPKSHSVFIPYGIFGAGWDEPQALYNVKSPPENVGIIGRLCAQKGQLAYLRYLASRYSDPESDMPFTLHLFGDGPHRAAIEHEIVHFGDKVMLHGIVLDREKMFRTLDVIAIPSQYEGMSNVMLEAAGRGIPFISYPVSGAAEMDKFESGKIVTTAKEMTSVLVQGLLSTIKGDSVIQIREFCSIKQCLGQHDELYCQFLR